MSNSEVPHIFIIQKEQEGCFFLECVRHPVREFAVGIQTDKDFKMVYIGTDKKHAEKLYSELVSKRKS